MFSTWYLEMVCRKWGLSGDEKNIVEVSKFQTED
jgi:hypothetical protein